MLEDLFNDFITWISDRKDIWEKKNVFVDDIVKSTYANQIHINLHSEEGFGHIGLFESNDIYWIEFEAVVEDFKSYYKYLEIKTLPNLDEIEQEYISFIS